MHIFTLDNQRYWLQQESMKNKTGRLAEGQLVFLYPNFFEVPLVVWIGANQSRGYLHIPFTYGKPWQNIVVF